MLGCPGPQIFASSNEESFEMSVAETIHDLRFTA
jgi:putative sigma-54 modulation protein